MLLHEVLSKHNALYIAAEARRNHVLGAALALAKRHDIEAKVLKARRAVSRGYSGKQGIVEAQQ